MDVVQTIERSPAQHVCAICCVVDTGGYLRRVVLRRYSWISFERIDVEYDVERLNTCRGGPAHQSVTAGIPSRCCGDSSSCRPPPAGARAAATPLCRRGEGFRLPEEWPPASVGPAPPAVLPAARPAARSARRSPLMKVRLFRSDAPGLDGGGGFCFTASSLRAPLEPPSAPLAAVSRGGGGGLWPGRGCFRAESALACGSGGGRAVARLGIMARSSLAAAATDSAAPITGPKACSSRRRSLSAARRRRSSPASSTRTATSALAAVALAASSSHLSPDLPQIRVD